MKKKKSSKLSCVMISCKKCGAKVFRDYYATHFYAEHKSKVSIDDARKMINENLDKYGNLIRKNDAQSSKSKKYIEPFGLTVIKGLSKSEKFKANSKQSCSDCGRPVAYLDVGDRKSKAFDVDNFNYILGTHACGNFRGESLYTFSGGAIDSNRRRH